MSEILKMQKLASEAVDDWCISLLSVFRTK